MFLKKKPSANFKDLSENTGQQITVYHAYSLQLIALHDPKLIAFFFSTSQTLPFKEKGNCAKDYYCAVLVKFCIIGVIMYQMTYV